MLIDPALTERDFYKVMSGVIVPRPIAFVSTVDSEGTPNLAPFSYFMPVSDVPPILCISIGGRAGEAKDTLRNIEATGEFVVNVVTEEIGAAMNVTSAEYPPEVNEFSEAGLTASPAVRVRAPLVAESPVNMECRLLEILRFPRGRSGSGVVLGEIVLVHIRDELLRPDGSIDTLRLQALGRLSGALYCRTTDQVVHVRPRIAG